MLGQSLRIVLSSAEQSPFPTVLKLHHQAAAVALHADHVHQEGLFVGGLGFGGSAAPPPSRTWWCE